MPTLLERYDAGERRGVWDELHALGSLAAVAASVRDDVDAVARRTMERAFSNARTIHDRLVEMGYVFDDADRAIEPANDELIAAERTLVEEIGSVPASLRAWFRCCGKIFFRGWLPSAGTRSAWRSRYLDPIEFGIDASYVASEIAAFRENEEAGHAVSFKLDFAGDYLHKNEISGGAATGLFLPTDEADAQVVEDDGVWHGEYMAKRLELGDYHAAIAAVPRPPDVPIWFVDYLRLYFEAGFARDGRAGKGHTCRSQTHAGDSARGCRLSVHRPP